MADELKPTRTTAPVESRTNSVPSHDQNPEPASGNGPALFAKWKRFVPETLIGILLLAAFDFLVLDSNSFAAAGQMHPYWVVILLISVQYGLAGGVFAALVSAVAFFAVGLGGGVTGGDFYDGARNVLTLPVLWLMTSVILGALRSIHIFKESRVIEKSQEYQQAADIFAGNLETAQKQIKRLETRVAADTGSSDTLLKDLTKIDASSRPSFVKSLRDILADAGQVSVHAIYTCRNGQFDLIDAFDSETSAERKEPYGFDTEGVHAYFRDTQASLVRSSRAGTNLLSPGIEFMTPIYGVDGAMTGLIIVERLRKEADESRSIRRVEFLANVIGKFMPKGEVVPLTTATPSNDPVGGGSSNGSIRVETLG